MDKEILDIALDLLEESDNILGTLMQGPVGLNPHMMKREYESFYQKYILFTNSLNNLHALGSKVSKT